MHEEDLAAKAAAGIDNNPGMAEAIKESKKLVDQQQVMKNMQAAEPAKNSTSLA